MIKASRHNSINDSGFTLLELMFVIAIIGILAIVGVPKYSAVKENYRLENGAQKAVSQLQYGRQLAVDKRETIYITFQKDQVGVYRNNGGTLELVGPALPYEGGVTFSTATTGNNWLYEIHQNPSDAASALLGYGISYDFRGFHKNPAQSGTIRLQSLSGQTVCILIGEGTGRIVIDQCEEDAGNNGGGEEEPPTFCEQDDGPLPNYPAWVAQPYSSAGIYVIYNGRVFYTRWYANASDIPGTADAVNPGPWQEVTKQWRAFNYYNGGDRVCYNGKEFVMWAGYNNQHGNAPGIVNNPWQEQTNEWRPFNRYNTGDIVLYNGSEFQQRDGQNIVNKQPGLMDSPWQELTDQWRNFNVYSKDNVVIYNGLQFKMRNNYSKNQQPGLMSSPWQEITDQWRSFNIYDTGDEVLYNGIRYRAKWYNQNVTPNPSDPYGAWQKIS